MFKKEIRIALTLALATCLYTLPARAALMNFTGTFAVQIENTSVSTPFSGRADVNTSTGAFTFVEGSDVAVEYFGALEGHPIFDTLVLAMTFQPDAAAFAPGEGWLGGFGGTAPIAVGFLGATNGVGDYVVNAEGLLGVASAANLGTSHYASIDMSSALLGTEWFDGSYAFSVEGRSVFMAGGDERTESQGGLLTLVTPIYLSGGLTNGGLGGTATLNMNFGLVHAPEPGTALLLGAGVLGLTVAGRRKRSN